MSDDKQYREDSSEEEWIGSFYGSSKSSKTVRHQTKKQIQLIKKIIKMVSLRIVEEIYLH